MFIQAGSGGVGTFAIQLAKHLGATVATTTSAANVGLVESLGADVVIDYKTQDFEDVLRDYDVVLNSQDGKTLEKSLRILKRGGKLISISGPPDPEFGNAIAAPWFVKLVMWLLSSGVRRKARGLGIGYSFLFMEANGTQLREISRLIEAGAIRPVIDRVFPFESTNEALAGIALVFPLSMLMLQMSGGGIGGAVTAAVARALGAGRDEDAGRLAQQSLFIGCLLAAAFTVVLLGFGRNIFAAMGGRGAALDAAIAYSTVLFSGAIVI